MAKKVRDKSFQGMDLGEIQELINVTPWASIEADLMEVSTLKPVPDNEEEDLEAAGPEAHRRSTIQQEGSDHPRLFLTFFFF